MIEALEQADRDGRGQWRYAAGVTALALTLIGCGIAGTLAALQGLWGTLTVTALVGSWVLLLVWWSQAWPRRQIAARPAFATEDAAPALRSLLDQTPTPLLVVEGGRARTLNRAARTLFGSDDGLSPVPPALLDRSSSHLDHEGRRWRLNTVEVVDEADRRLVALTDVGAEQQMAEARATSEMIQVLGHELLNGLAPIASLAESGLATLDDPARRDRLLPEILATLARRADGLQRFTESYRRLARLPEPIRTAIDVDRMMDDLSRLFSGRWGGVVRLTVGRAADLRFDADRDQIEQALWALIQNAAEAAAGGADPAVHVGVCHEAAATRFTIEDSGPGVPPADAGRVFRPFHTTKATGTGIGLSLARQIALAHGGELTLRGRNRFVLIVPDLT